MRTEHLLWLGGGILIGVFVVPMVFRLLGSKQG